MNSTLLTRSGNSLSGPFPGKPAVRVSGLLFIILGSASLIMLFSFWSYKGRFWANWYPLMISASYINEDLESFLSDLSGGEMISESNSFLEYNGFGETELIRVSELGTEKGLYVDDPRLDPYMAGSSSFFRQDGYGIYYLPADQSPFAYEQQLRKSFPVPASEWQLPDFSFSRIPVLLFAGIIILLCAGSLRFCIPAAGFLALGFFVFSSGDNHLLIILVLAALPVRYMIDGANPFFWAMFLPPLILGRVISILDLRYTAALVALGCLSFGVSLALPPLRAFLPERVRAGRKEAGRDHVLFQPVPLTGTIEKDKGKRSRPTLTLAVAALSLLLLVLSAQKEIFLPAGIPAAESTGLDWEFDSLAAADGISDFPGVCAYFRHRAYQDSFIYDGDYGLPRPGSALSVDDFTFEDGVVISRPRIVLNFDSNWFRSTLLHMRESGSGRLTGSEEFIPSVVKRRSYLYGHSTGILLCSALCLLLNLYIRIFGMHPGRHGRSDRFSAKFVFRRKQQAA